MRSDHKDRHTKWSQKSKNDIEDKRKISEAENYKKKKKLKNNLLIANTQKIKGMKKLFEINLKKQIWKTWAGGGKPVISLKSWKKKQIK